MIAPLLLEGPVASLDEILLRREQRWQEQRELLSRGQCLVSFTMNIPGAKKQFPLERAGFETGARELRTLFPIREERLHSAVTGDEALLLLDLPAWEVKKKTVILEESHPLGRLWDMDVLDREGRSLSRTTLGLPQRRCLVCGEAAKVCGRSRRHSPEQLFRCTAQRLHDFFRTQAADTAGSCALKAVLSEVSVTPKPGLVDRRDSGSHTDMDFFTFVDSSAALAPWFRRFFLAGWDHAGGLFGVLRALGQQAETDMFAATKGVNTHKGLIFSMAILCGALGRASAEAFPQSPSLDQISEIARSLGADSMKDFAASSGETSGLRCYHAHGLSGIRGEAAAGFPAVINVGLPTLRQWLSRGVSLNDASCAALLALIAAVDDTNMIRRGGYEEAAARKTEARCLSAALRAERICPALSALNEAYIQKNLSPGGCADLLALTLFFHFLNL